MKRQPGRGQVGTGLHAHEWAHILRAEVQKNGRVVVPDPGTEHGRRLVRALGARVAPVREAT